VKRSVILATVVAATGMFVAACGGSSKSTSSSGGGGTSASSTPGADTAAGAKGGTLTTLANAAPSGSPDPQVNYTLQEWQFLIITHDGLVGFKRTSGAEGATLVPDLATTLPTPTDNGRTYQFTLRPGIKFSNGKVVTGQDVKATFERLFKIGDSPNAGTWYNAIEGGDACVKTPKTCDLSKGIVVNGDQITFHLSRADPEFLQQLALPFAFVLPADTPAKHVDIPPPGTGPYKWAEYKPTTAMRVVRNPFFKEWSKDAQPAGLPDIIEQKFGLSVQAEVTQVENGQADWISNTDTIPADRLPELSRKYPKQLHVNPLLQTEYMALNTNVPPFDNEKARQAVNFATDRSAIVKIYGGPQLASPTCQVLPPNLPGYQPYCPFTANPGSGKWTAPDLAQAKALVKQSGTAGQKVAIVGANDEVTKGMLTYLQSVLNSIGYKATIKPLSSNISFTYIQNTKNKVQISVSQWYQDYPSPSDFLNVLLGCGSFHPGSDTSINISGYCNKKVNADMQKALQLGIEDPPAALKLWTKVDKATTDDAAQAVLFNPRLIDFVSKRVGNYIWSAQFYTLVGQVWVQ